MKFRKTKKGKSVMSNPQQHVSAEPPTPKPAGAETANVVYSLLAKDHPTQSEFKTLLENVSTGVLAKRYLHTGLPFVFKNEPHKYLAFREAVGKVFGVPAQNIVVMGSARFGFSTSPRKQDGGAKHLDQTSDMDLVIISREFIAQALESFANYAFKILRDIDELKSDAKDEKEKVSLSKLHLLALRRRSKSLHFGYVNPGDFEDGTNEKQAFYDMKREAGTLLLGTAPPGPISRVGAWVYRDWDAAERMYEFSFNQLAKTLGVHAIDNVPEADEILE